MQRLTSIKKIFIMNHDFQFATSLEFNMYSSEKIKRSLSKYYTLKLFRVSSSNLASPQIPYTTNKRVTSADGTSSKIVNSSFVSSATYMPKIIIVLFAYNTVILFRIATDGSVVTSPGYNTEKLLQ